MTTGEWLLNQIGLHEPGLWLALSLLTGLVLIAVRRSGIRRYARLAAASRRLLIPYCALIAGAVSPRLMGVQHINWATSFTLGLGLLFGGLLLVALVRATMLALPDDAAGIRTGDDGAEPSALAMPPGAHTLPAVMLVSGFLEWHWAFLRGGTWELALSYPDPLALPGYWAIWIAAGFALVDLATDTSSAASWIVQAVALIMTSILFFYTRNFWLCWLMHAGVQLILMPPPRAILDSRPSAQN